MNPRLISIAVLLLVGACTFDEAPAPGDFAGVPPEGEVRLPDLTFPDMFGRPYSLATGASTALTNEAGEPFAVTLLFIGYTYCPDVCPVHLANLATVLRDIPLEQARQVRTIFLTADPQRDTEERLQEWLGTIHPDFVGLRGSRAEINALEDSLMVPRSVVEPGDTPETYFVGHAGQVMAFGPDGVARAVYPWGIRQRDWRSDLPRLIRGDWPPEAASTAPLDRTPPDEASGIAGAESATGDN